MVAVAWIFAYFIFGNLVGFLFGVPKNNQPLSTENPATGTESDYTPLVNNNLIEISDWLTKIIVGLSLINLAKIPSYLFKMANVLALGITGTQTNENSALSFSYALILTFLVLGFLFGYLVTRLYLAGIIVTSDKNLYKQISNKLAVVGSKLDTLETGQTVLTARANSSPAKAAVISKKPADLEFLENLAIKYMNITDPNYGVRVELKQQAAAQMTVYAASNNISKDDILALYAEKPNEGLLIGLATLIIMEPEEGDVGRLLKYGDQVTRKHIQYRFLTAFSKLLDKQLIHASDKEPIATLTKRFSSKGNASLREKASLLLLLLDQYNS